MNLVFPFFVKHKQSFAEEFITRVSPQIISGNVSVAARWYAQFEVASTHFSRFTLWKASIHFDMERSTQQLFVWGYLKKTGGVSALDSYWRLKKTYLETVSEARRIPEWVMPILYIPKGVEQ